MNHGMLARGVGFKPPSQDLAIEIVYASIVIILCLIVYFRTRELYKLSSHKGIEHFRNAFLFFAIAYFARFLAHVFIVNGITFGLHRYYILAVGLIPFAFASSMAILSLTFSTFWRKWKWFDEYYLLYGLAILITLIVYLGKSPLVLTISQIILLVITITMSFINQMKRKSKLYAIYLLIFLFWVLNLIATTVPRFLIEIKIPLYIISAGVFALLTHKVIKTISDKKNGKKKR